MFTVLWSHAVSDFSVPVIFYTPLWVFTHTPWWAPPQTQTVINRHPSGGVITAIPRSLLLADHTRQLMLLSIPLRGQKYQTDGRGLVVQHCTKTRMIDRAFRVAQVCSQDVYNVWCSLADLQIISVLTACDVSIFTDNTQMNTLSLWLSIMTTG